MPHSQLKGYCLARSKYSAARKSHTHLLIHDKQASCIRRCGLEAVVGRAGTGPCCRQPHTPTTADASQQRQQHSHKPQQDYE